MHVHLKITALALFVAGAASAQNQDTSFLTKENSDPSLTAEYWTPERLKNAKEMPMPEVDANAIKVLEDNYFDNSESEQADGALPKVDVTPDLKPLFKVEPLTNSKTPSFNRGTFNQEFSSSRLIPLTADNSYPYRTVGKLFFTQPGVGNFVCSASVLRHRILVTAGHCLHSGSGGSAGFYTNFQFIPAFRDGAAPFYTWNWSFAIVTSTWATGGGTVPNAADYGMIELQDKSISGTLQRIGLVTGYLGYQTQSLLPNHAHLLGYPCNLDSCQKMHQVAAQSARNVAPNNVEYGSDMRGGSSGGPWIQNFGATATGQSGGLNSGVNRIVGITSYGYTSTDLKSQGSSIPDSRFISILNTICAHKAGNCT